MTPNKDIQASWIVEGKYFYDPETKSNSNVLHELFSNEDEAMKFAAEKSRSHHAEINVIASMDGECLPVAEYKKGEEQFEKRALEIIIQDCRMFAECPGKIGVSLSTMLLCCGCALLVWAYGATVISHLFDIGSPDYLIGICIETAAIIVAGFYLDKWADKRALRYAAEAEKWARQIAYRVSKTDRVLLERIFTTMRENPVRKPMLGSEFES